MSEFLKVTYGDAASVGSTRTAEARLSKPTRSAKQVPLWVNGTAVAGAARPGGYRPLDRGETERYEPETYFRYNRRTYCIRGWNAMNAIRPTIEVTG